MGYGILLVINGNLCICIYKYYMDMENIGKLAGQNRGWIKIHGNDSFKHMTYNCEHVFCPPVVPFRDET
jgi:hypothetical protein